MYLSKIRVIDYKSFRDSGEIEFKQGINLIVGQNNSGKTTLLEALEIKIKDIPHRSVNTEKNKIYSNNERDNSILEVSLCANKDDLFDLSQIKDNSIFRFPFPQKYIDSLKPFPIDTNNPIREELIKKLENSQNDICNKIKTIINKVRANTITEHHQIR